MMGNWKVYAKKADFKSLGEKFEIDQVTARIIRNRGLTSDREYEEYLYGDLTDLPSPLLMQGVRRAVDIINRAIGDNKHIRIIGDYDIDGICSIYILHYALQKLNANADYVVPDRIIDGYGINENLISRAARDGVSVIITCDNGIAAYSAVAYAKSLGIEIIITDHHDVPFEVQDDGSKRYILPPADAIINPKQPECEYPFKQLCGAAVAWKLVTALLGQKPYENKILMHLLELAAIATVGDIVSLLGENRIIVKQGLRRIRSGSGSIGLRALIEECGVDESSFGEYHIGFVVGPCLNASGRLDTAQKAIALLESEDYDEAKHLAHELKQLNDVRKEMTEKGVNDACNEVERLYRGDIPPIIIIYLKDCHESVAGIIAGRVRERYYRPTIICADSIGESGMYKASGRSIEGFDMFEKISCCREFLAKFGGHSMAAGMSLKKDDFESFRTKMLENASMDEQALTPVIWIDVPMPLDYVTEKIVSQLELLAPFGKDNEKPLFADRGLRILDKKAVGRNKDVLKMRLMTPAGRTFEAVKFHADDRELEEFKCNDIISIVYYPVMNVYNGTERLQINITDMKKPD